MKKYFGIDFARQLYYKTMLDSEINDRIDEITFDDPVTPQEWSEPHPANIKCASDAYYANLACRNISWS